jgi:hypothetical protein
MLVIGLCWGTSAEAKKWSKTEEFVEAKELLDRLCPEDSSALVDHLATPYPDEPLEVFDGWTKGQASSNAHDLGDLIGEVVSVCQEWRAFLAELGDQPFKKKEAAGIQKKLRWLWTPWVRGGFGHHSNHGLNNGPLDIGSYGKTTPVPQNQMKMGFYEKCFDYSDFQEGSDERFVSKNYYYWNYIPNESCGVAKYGTGGLVKRCGGEYVVNDTGALKGNEKSPSFIYFERELEEINDRALAPTYLLLRVAKRWEEHLAANYPFPRENTTFKAFQHAAESCLADRNTYVEAVGAEQKRIEAEEQSNQFRALTSRAIRICEKSGTDPDPTRDSAFDIEQRLKACSVATPDWQEKAESLANTGAEKKKLTTFLSTLPSRIQGLEDALKQAGDNETECMSLAAKAHTKKLALKWKECMSEANLTSTAIKYALTDNDLYDEHMKKSALTCAQSTGVDALNKAFHNSCNYSHPGFNYRGSPGFWIDDSEIPVLCYETRWRRSLCIEDMLRDKYKPNND